MPSGSNAVAGDGRIAVTVMGPASWFLYAGILDSRTGKVEISKASLGFDSAPGWMADGTLLTEANSYQARLWRFMPVKQ